MGERIEQEYYRNGTLKRRSYYNDKDKLHRLDGPAEEVFWVMVQLQNVNGVSTARSTVLTVRLCKDGTIMQRGWYIHGRLHREDGPAQEGFYKDGALQQRGWRIDGVYYRKNGPAYESFYNNGKLKSREWMAYGQPHRLDGPAGEWFYENGIAESHEWCQNGFLHRENAPAIEWFDTDGKLTHCEWFCNGKRHRIDGPARESFVDIGTESESVYWIDDIQISKEEHRRRVALLKLHTKITIDPHEILL
jgi:antitoxin component YwqK of YwqJK toxin-antitoxin module